jgi:hypothetical protein
MTPIPSPDPRKKKGNRGRPRKPVAPAGELPGPGSLFGPEPVLLDPIIPPDDPPPSAAGLSARQRAYILSLASELEKRRCESLRLYEPLPAQMGFHLCPARQRLCRGSNRAGKTLTSMVELAWAVTGQHPDRGKYPERDGRVIAVARDEGKVGEVFYHKLFRAGAFKIVRDPISGEWRSYRPATDGPLGLKPKPAPPLIPPRFIKDIAWVSKKQGIPRKVILHNGWEINFYSSKADPDSIQGMDVDIGIFDEEIVHNQWFPETIARLVDRKGRFWWGATPQAGTQHLYDLHLRAQSQAEEGIENPVAAEHFLSIRDNPHLDETAKKEFIDSLDDEERRVRVDGDFAVTGLRIYDSYFFPNGVHVVDAFAVPPDWTHVLAIDPGAQVCAVLFAAVPPMKYDGGPVPEELFGDFVYLYDELYLRHCDAKKFAVAMKQKVVDQEFRSYLFDHHGGRLTEIGSGKTPEQQYRDALRKEKVPHFTPPRSGTFTYGSDDLDGGIMKVKEMLRVREDGTSKIRMLRGRCPNFVREMQRYQVKVVNGVPTDKPVKKDDHLVDCLRYICMYPNLRYRKPDRPSTRQHGGAYDAFQAKKRRDASRAKASGGAGVTLGSGKS